MVILQDLFLKFPHQLNFKGITIAALLSLSFGSLTHASKLVEFTVLDQDYLMLVFYDGEVHHVDQPDIPHDDQDEVIAYAPALDVNAAQQAANYTLTSNDDSHYGTTGANPTQVHRKTKMNGHAEQQWLSSDYQYEKTFAHTLFLQLPSPLVQGAAYSLEIGSNLGSDQTSLSLTFDIFNLRSEAIHLNLVGYSPTSPTHSADLYSWMGDGGSRDYSSFAGSTVHLYNVTTGEAVPAGTVQFGSSESDDVFWYNLIRSDVWHLDFSGTEPGTYRLAVEGIGSSQDFNLSPSIYFEPFRVGVLGFFYMRIGQDSTGGITPTPRRPLYIPDTDPADTKVYLTTMHPWHSEWESFSSGDVWDRPDDWVDHRKSGNPENPLAYGGHSDAADWDRHLGHISIIYDMLLPFILTAGAIDEDNLGIAESGNGIPDILDEARNEVDFWLRLRDGAGYSHGLTNPNSSNQLFQAAPTAIAAWANAANAALLADCFRLSGHTDLAAEYRDSAVIAYNYAVGLADPMLDETQGIGNTQIRGRDLKMTAAAALYNLTGESIYENIVLEESLCTTPESEFSHAEDFNQVWGTAVYLMSPQTMGQPDLYANMKASVIFQAKTKEVSLSAERPSRRTTDNNTGYFRTAQQVHRTLIAHAVTDDPAEKAEFLQALLLEADWGLGRNPLNMIQMTTASTPLASKRSVQGAYTSGRNDGTPGLHPGHTPYMNLDDWACGMTMGCPTRLFEGIYPGDFLNTWPIGEGYFNTRYVWAHNEFTPQQTMGGKMALYGYLYGIGEKADPSSIRPKPRAKNNTDLFSLTGNQLDMTQDGFYEVSVRDLRGKLLWSFKGFLSQEKLALPKLQTRSGVHLISVSRGNLTQRKKLARY